MQTMTLSLIDVIGFAASALVFLTFCMRTLLPLRLLALASNLLFIAYGLAAGLMPILVLHLLLFPMNLLRTAQQVGARRRMRASLARAPSLAALIPFMDTTDCVDGTVLFRRGDDADHVYVIVEGQVLIEEVGTVLKAGDIFGEIAFFAEDGKRNATARTMGPVSLAWLDRDGLMRLCIESPEFALHLSRLMVARLTQNERAAGH